jgi:hypothetical protein
LAKSLFSLGYVLFAPSSEELAATRTVESIARETEAANATDTPTPTNTPEPTPTFTLTPIPTDTPILDPTDTPIPTKPPPTKTPVPTDTSIPTFTPTITPEPTSTPSVNFSFFRQWKPNDNPNGFGADILLEDDLDKEGLIAFIISLSVDYDPVLITIWTSEVAYDQNEKGEFGDEFREGFIAVYVKNFTGVGAYAGFNEIRWMQEIGKFSDLFGEVTKF